MKVVVKNVFGTNGLGLRALIVAHSVPATGVFRDSCSISGGGCHNSKVVATEQ